MQNTINLNLFIDPKVGIIQGYEEIPINTDDPLLFYGSTAMPDTFLYANHSCYNRCGGAGLDSKEALFASIGESIERYCSSFYYEDELIFSSYSKIKKEAVHPEQFALFSEEQYAQSGFPFVKFSENTSIRWIKGISIVTREEKYVPACMVYVPYKKMNDEAFIYPSISTGLACGLSLESAILNGIYEVVERDAIMMMWLNRIHSSRIDMKTGLTNKLYKIFNDRFLPSGQNFICNDITSDLGIPTFFITIIDTTEKGPAVSCGAACRLNADNAILKALIEASQSRLATKYLMTQKPDYSWNEDFSNIKKFEYHVLLYADRRMSSAMNFLINANESNEKYGAAYNVNSNKKEELKKCLSILAEKKYDVIVVDITTDDVRRLGFYVVRIIIPGLQPLYADFRYRFLGGKRLKIKSTQDRKTINEKGLNPYPHPFP